jgi:N-dimethylarginine dimethylaminohydrolase
MLELGGCMDKVKEALKKVDKTRPAVPIPLSYDDELKHIWGKNWGAQSEIGKLREVLVHRPGSEIAPPKKDLKWYGMKSVPDVSRAVEQHDRFVEILKDEGVKVHYLNPDPKAKGPYAPFQGLWGTRDFGFVVRGGAIVHRMALPWDRGAESWWAKRVMELGCPILYTVRGYGTFEGGNVVWLDPAHVCIGKSIRTNQEGIDQVSAILASMGVEEIKIVPIPGWLENVDWPAGGFAHLDCVFGYVDSGVALIYPPGVPYDFLEYLQEKEINLIEVPPEEAKDYACNTLALEPGKIIMLEGFEATRKKLEKEAVEVITVNMSEFIKLGGGPHCASSPLIRDPGPKL